ncbi:hypothetical protein SKAU_G00120530 [Synaphobranchus kaupii]|uniref:Disks large-associated protein 5 n=1 Tax=Synaphobranchus kaupii TaxID=118154 RepID=A0A9Q1FPA6_SYNKA|nr:hypothetical protein SKAU_G00120530 [Synaphobranchus kaupii]
MRRFSVESGSLALKTPSIPEESRDRMRTAIGQARLLVKERFHQFLGLVDDCDLGRGEKVTTCTDLQGFWDMVYFQVEDVIRKFDALREAEVKGLAGGAQASAPPEKDEEACPGSSRREACSGGRGQRGCPDSPGREAQPDPDPAPAAQTVVFNGGFFRVESPRPRARGLKRILSQECRPLPPWLSLPWLTVHHPSEASALCAQSSPPKPTLHAGAPLWPVGGMTPGSRLHPRVPQEPVAASADGQTQQTGTCSQPPEAPSSQSQTLEGWAEPNGLSKLVPEGAGHTASQLEGVAEPKTDSCVLPVPCAHSPSGQALMADTEGQNSSLSLSPCQKADLHPTEGHGLSFTLSPCPSNGGEQRSPPALSPSLPAPLGSHTPAPCSTDSPAGSSEACMAVTPDTSYVENAPGLDF